MRSHYISRQTFATVEWKAQTFVHWKFLASSSVSRWKFCWCFWMEQLKRICKQRHCSVNSKTSFGCCPCKLYVEQTLLFSLFWKKINFNVDILMDVLLDEWPWLLNIHKSETVADLLYVTCFCNVYTWILIKYQLHFDFLVVFTPLLRPCQLLYHVSWLLYCCSLHSFFLY